MAENTGLNNEAEHHPGDASTSAPAVKAKGNRWQQAGLAILAVVFLALLVDTAVETYLGGADIRWWVASTVVAYLILTAVLYWKVDSVRQRLGWTGSAALSLLVFLALLVFAASQPDGFSQGVRLLGQSTSAVYSGVIAIAIAASALILLRLVAFHPVLSLAIGALATYGIAAFVFGIVTNTPFVDLFAGASLWQRLPFWLQGSFVGGLLLIACALLYQIVHGILKVRGAELRAFGVKVLCLMLSFSLALQGSYLTPLQSTGLVVKQTEKENTRPDGLDANAQLTREEALDKLEKLFDALEAVEKEIPRDTFDPQAIIDEVGKDPVKLFEWVRDNTVLVPYQGVLRGHMGVLMDRMGNSLDRSLLLHELLTLAGHQARLARGTLTENQAAELYANLKPIPVRRYEENEAALDAGIKRFADEFGLNVEEMRRTLQSAKNDQDRIAGEIRERIKDQTEMLIKAVGRPDPSVEDEERAWQKQSLQDHWWVQWRNGAKWSDMDLTIQGGAPGDVLTSILSIEQRDQLDKDVYHTMQIRVIAEFAEQGKLREEVALSHTLVPSNILGEPIVLRHLPMNWPENLNLFEEQDLQKRLSDLILNENQWLPILAVGERNIYEYIVEIDNGLISPLAKTVPRIPNGPIDIFDTLPTEESEGAEIGGDKSTSSSHTELTASWIEYQINSPARAPKIFRRPIFEFFGPARGKARTIDLKSISNASRFARNLRLMGYTEILPVTSAVSGDYILSALANDIFEKKDILVALVGNLNEQPSKRIELFVGRKERMPVPIYLFALLRDFWNRFSSVTFLDTPNIVTFHRTLLQTQGGDLVIRETFDIVENYVAVIPSNTSNFEIRLELGVVDTNTEASLLKSSCEQCKSVINTAELFALSEAQGVEWMALLDTENVDWSSIDLPDDVKRRLRKQLGDGYALSVPTREVILEGMDAVGWWRIDPITGQTLGIGANGRGASSIEYMAAVTPTVISVLMCTVSVASDIPSAGSVDYRHTRFAHCLSGFATSWIGNYFLLRRTADMKLIAAYMYLGGELQMVLAGGPPPHVDD